MVVVVKKLEAIYFLTIIGLNSRVSFKQELHDKIKASHKQQNQTSSHGRKVNHHLHFPHGCAQNLHFLAIKPQITTATTCG